MELQTAKNELQTAEGKLQTAKNELQTAEGKLQTAEGKLQTAEGKLQTAKNELQAAKLQADPDAILIANRQVKICFEQIENCNKAVETCNKAVETCNKAVESWGDCVSSLLKPGGLARVPAFVKDPTLQSKMFPRNGIGQQLFLRSGLVEAATQEIMTGKSSHYWRGPPGSGKTLFLHLVGCRLLELGFLVYHINDAGFLNMLDRNTFQNLAQAGREIGKDSVLLIDEVHQNFTSPMWTILLKENIKNLIVVGVGVKRLSAISPQFEFKHSSSDMMINQVDTHIIDFWRTQRPNLDEKTVAFACEFLLRYTGGHFYPFLKFAEHVFGDAKVSLDQASLQQYLSHEHFIQTVVYRDVVSRCFSGLEGESFDMAQAILMGDDKYPRARTLLEDLGLWNEEKGWFGSDMLVGYLLSRIVHDAKNGPPVELCGDTNCDTNWLKNMDILIKAGLEGMSEDDFLEPKRKNNWRYENSLGFAWACSVKRAVRNVYLTPQTQANATDNVRGPRPTVDFYVDGRVDAALELARNADKSTLLEKFDKFQPVRQVGKYNGQPGPYCQWSNYAVLNFDLSSNSTPVLVDEPRHNERLYTFLKASNTLFRGSNVMANNVVRGLPSIPKRSFAAFARYVGMAAIGCLQKKKT